MTVIPLLHAKPPERTGVRRARERLETTQNHPGPANKEKKNLSISQRLTEGSSSASRLRRPRASQTGKLEPPGSYSVGPPVVVTYIPLRARFARSQGKYLCPRWPYRDSNPSYGYDHVFAIGGE